MPSRPRHEPPAAGSRLHVVSDRGALLGLRRLRLVELPVALLDTAGPLVAGNRRADMIRAGVVAFGSDLPLRFAVGQSRT